MTLSNAVEGSSYGIRIDFTDRIGAAAIPTSATYTLTDAQGTVINSQIEVAISPAASVTIVLSGDDLALGAPYFGKRRTLTVEGVYSSSLGSSLPFKFEEYFYITDLLNITSVFDDDPYGGYDRGYD